MMTDDDKRNFDEMVTTCAAFLPNIMGFARRIPWSVHYRQPPRNLLGIVPDDCPPDGAIRDALLGLRLWSRHESVQP